MRFPRINRLRWDKPPREADRLETLERMLKADATQAGAVSDGVGIPSLEENLSKQPN
jgi:DNA ligase-1